LFVTEEGIFRIPDRGRWYNVLEKGDVSAEVKDGGFLSEMRRESKFGGTEYAKISRSAGFCDGRREEYDPENRGGVRIFRRVL
jgi:hypothetical protein